MIMLNDIAVREAFHVALLRRLAPTGGMMPLRNPYLTQLHCATLRQMTCPSSCLTIHDRLHSAKRSPPLRFEQRYSLATYSIWRF